MIDEQVNHATTKSYFDQQKALKLRQLKQQEDKSPKGSIDAPIVDFMHELNRHPDYVTTR